MKKIRNHVERLFHDLPETEEVIQVKEEIVLNLQEKAQDLMVQGKTEEDAINKTIVDFGDIDEIKAELQQPSEQMSPVKKKHTRLNLWFSVWGSVLFISLMWFMNVEYSPNTIWFVYPTFAILWWPLSMYYYWRRQGGGK
ncbi:permease prefix domain 1-containing protein [Alkalicoccobacillus plakortidis]|uniref:Permease prefix domain 1-containing protein n=1 Tax=Alkalicoccobacillus plakortidis TaxID=444060 RepID=A0ABT0XJX1_9BACI|nr:permease prefix domain 1-containing protein [Alkalicoccobacillus plakortidis]MCM2676193.1 permease prefix domain 1-containing protein [Alkalicoccobacillus plakortidis]